MLSTIIAFLVVLNPFALFIYLAPLMKKLKHKEFVYVLFKASVISFFVFLVFALAGSFLLEKVFQINFEAFRIFGGIIVFSFAYVFILKGKKALIMMKVNLDDLAEEIALPFMVGAATLSLSIIMGNHYNWFFVLFALWFILAVNFFVILGMKFIRDDIKSKKYKIAFDKQMALVLKVNAFIIGAIGVNMVIQGINNLYL